MMDILWTVSWREVGTYALENSIATKKRRLYIDSDWIPRETHLYSIA
jgi:hypothetical protein